MAESKKKRLDLEDLLTRIVSLLYTYAPNELSFSKVSRLTGVPRSTLYYYFGNSFSSLLQESAKFAMKEFVQLNSIEEDRAESTWEDFQRKRFKLAIETAAKYPWGPKVYFRFREDRSPLGDVIRDIETQFFVKTRESWRHYHQQGSEDLNLEKIVGSLKLGVLFGIASVISDSNTNAQNLLADTQKIDCIVNAVTKCTEELFRAP